MHLYISFHQVRLQSRTSADKLVSFLARHSRNITQLCDTCGNDPALVFPLAAYAECGEPSFLGPL